MTTLHCGEDAKATGGKGNLSTIQECFRALKAILKRLKRSLCSSVPASTGLRPVCILHVHVYCALHRVFILYFAFEYLYVRRDSHVESRINGQMEGTIDLPSCHAILATALSV